MNHVDTIFSLIEARGYKRYLEIGCADDGCFSQITIEKVGVDPVSGGTHRMTSDEFFANVGTARFDLVFIDGDHRHVQVMRDVEHALAVLAPGGCIVMHDCLPPNQQHEDPGACGTAWRAFAKLRTRADLNCVCGDYDYGVGIVQRERNEVPIGIPQSMAEMTYTQFEANRVAWMRPINAEEVQAFARRKAVALHKYEIAALLGSRYGLRSYAEICTPTTGNEFQFVNAEQFPRCARFMYYCPRGWSRKPSPPHTYQTETPTSTGFGHISEKFDLVFIDAWHEYHNAVEDLARALDLVAPGGVILLHDCNPCNEEYASPKLPAECAPGHCDRPWSGATYAAFLDRVLGASDLDYMTVDDDHGCGIISKDRKFPGTRPSDDAIAQWKALSTSEKYPFFDEHRSELLRLRTPTEFLAQMEA